MEQRHLGKTGLTVSALGFGAGNVGGLMVRGTPAERSLPRAPFPPDHAPRASCEGVAAGLERGKQVRVLLLHLLKQPVDTAGHPPTNLRIQHIAEARVRRGCPGCHTGNFVLNGVRALSHVVALLCLAQFRESSVGFPPRATETDSPAKPPQLTIPPLPLRTPTRTIICEGALRGGGFWNRREGPSKRADEWHVFDRGTKGPARVAFSKVSLFTNYIAVLL